MRAIRKTLLFIGIIAGAMGGACNGEDAKVEDAAKPTGFAVVELFTSEGCSSCPPADAVLSDIVKDARKSGAPIYPLAFHVDYWNYLGWTDRFSSAEASTRQRDYAAVLHTDNIYTPQMIVNGSTEFVGSNTAKADDVIKTALKTIHQATIAMTVSKTGNMIAVKFTTTRATGQMVVAAVVQRGLSTRVATGENGGHILHHENVVRAFSAVNIAASGDGIIELKCPADVVPGDSSVVAFVQDPMTKKINAAISTDLGQ